MEELRDVRLGFRLAFETTFSDSPYQIVRLIPEFPRVRPDIAETTDIVWDLPQLCESIRRPGGYDVLNCTCGLGDHAGLTGLAFVAHPDDATVVWEIDIAGHRAALDARWPEASGFLRLVFRRDDYEVDIRAMLDAVVSASSLEPPVEEYDPNRGGDAYELLQARAADNDWSRQPVFDSGTLARTRSLRREPADAGWQAVARLPAPALYPLDGACRIRGLVGLSSPWIRRRQPAGGTGHCK